MPFSAAGPPLSRESPWVKGEEWTIYCLGHWANTLDQDIYWLCGRWITHLVVLIWVSGKSQQSKTLLWKGKGQVTLGGQAVVELPSLQGFNSGCPWMWHLGTWFGLAVLGKWLDSIVLEIFLNLNSVIQLVLWRISCVFQPAALELFLVGLVGPSSSSGLWVPGVSSSSVPFCILLKCTECISEDLRRSDRLITSILLNVLMFFLYFSKAVEMLSGCCQSEVEFNISKREEKISSIELQSYGQLDVVLVCFFSKLDHLPKNGVTL